MTDSSQPVGTDSSYETAWTIRARAEHRCHAHRCTNWIRPGEDYVRLVAFPGHDAHDGPGPWVMKLCQGCATEYGRPMPPRRGKRAEVA